MAAAILVVAGTGVEAAFVAGFGDAFGSAFLVAVFGIPFGATVGGFVGGVLVLLLGVTGNYHHARWVTMVLMVGVSLLVVGGTYPNLDRGLDLSLALVGQLVVVGATGLGWVSGLGFEWLMARS